MAIYWLILGHGRTEARGYLLANTGSWEDGGTCLFTG